MPMLCPGGFETCKVTLLARERFRKNNTDGMQMTLTLRFQFNIDPLSDASPGYFTQTLDNDIKVLWPSI